MGHGNSNKLYITHAEHSGLLGQHSASSSGHRAKQEAPHPGNRTPFDCCALTFQPWTHPVLARNQDGTGCVFELTNIIPWLKQHDNTNPVTKEPLAPGDLIALHYSKKGSGEIHDPITFKTFSEHSHIVAIATTGNVFLADSIKGGKDLIADIKFSKDDVVELQNPHGLPSVAVNKAPPKAPAEKAVAAPTKTATVASKPKEADPWNVSVYSSGNTGASLTSTSVDIQTMSSKLLWDEEEIMFEAISNPPKNKGKEKDVGKRRAYVRVVTSLGGASLNLELYCEKAPKTCYNFLQLAKQGKYNDVIFHRLVPGFMIQTGDPTGTGSGGESFWGTPFRDEYDLKGAAKHDERGVVSMANKGKDSNGSQFFITFGPKAHLDRKHTVFGKLVGGEQVLDALENLPIKPGTERPAKTVKITEVVIYQDPYDEYKTRLAKKLAKRAEAAATGVNAAAKRDTAAPTAGDSMNWFGTKVGADAGVGSGAGVGAGVGKYLAGAKRPLEAVVAPAGADGDKAKKKKLGFGDFAGW